MQILPVHFLATLNEAWLNEFVFVSQLRPTVFPSKILSRLLDPVWAGGVMSWCKCLSKSEDVCVHTDA